MRAQAETSFRRCYECAYRLQKPCFDCEDSKACRYGHDVWKREKERREKIRAIREAIYGECKTARDRKRVL